MKTSLIFIFLVSGTFIRIQNTAAQRGEYRVMFYNVENFFDTINDPHKNDEEFLPEGDRHWNSYKFYKKLDNMYKVIVAAGGWEPPEIIGLCEVENKYVLKSLIGSTPLIKFPYDIVHRDSPDSRGIDAAILYRTDKLTKLEEGFIPVYFPDNPNRKTREITYMKARTLNGDTLYFFVNHWPSRLGGAQASEISRMTAALALKTKVDSLLILNEKSKIIIMGDFNDEPLDKSLITGLGARNNFDSISFGNLYNLTSCFNTSNVPGSIKYQGQWSRFDQLIVSGSLLTRDNLLTTDCEHAFIFDEKFLLEDDNNYMGYKPFRTFNGYRYQKGFSDHLPVYLDLF